jgi:hypothetical protein
MRCTDRSLLAHPGDLAGKQETALLTHEAMNTGTQGTQIPQADLEREEGDSS